MQEDNRNEQERQSVQQEQTQNGEPLEPNVDEYYDKNDINARIAAFSEKKWKRVQIIVGVVLGLIASAALFLLQRVEEFGSFGFLIALLIALLVPRLAERKLERSIKQGRLAMVITLAACLVIYVGVVFVQNGMSFKIS